jgi:hypothetical protein
MWGRHRNLRAAILYGLRAAHWVYENAVSLHQARQKCNELVFAHSLPAAINFRVSSMADYYSVIARAVLTRRELT